MSVKVSAIDHIVINVSDVARSAEWYQKRLGMEIKEAYRAAAQSGRLVGLLEYSDDPLVSTDIVGSSASCVFDSELTMAHGSLVKVLGWYDNEAGYSSRLADLAAIVGATSSGQAAPGT